MIPLPPASQLRREGVKFYLGYRCVGQLDTSTGYLFKRVKGDLHTFKRKPGVAWNYELMALADRQNCQGLRIVVWNPEGEYGFEVSWTVARQYALAASEGDRRYLLKYDEDDQVLIPWAAWRGEELGPPVKKPKAKSGPPDNQGSLL